MAGPIVRVPIRTTSALASLRALVWSVGKEASSLTQGKRGLTEGYECREGLVDHIAQLPACGVDPDAGNDGLLALPLVLARRLAQYGGSGSDIENIIGQLECATSRLSVRRQASQLLGRRTADNRPDADGSANKCARLHRLHLGDTTISQGRSFAFDIAHLPADHAACSGSCGKFSDKSHPHLWVGMGFTVGQKTEGMGEERITRQDSRRIVKRPMDCRLAAAQIIVVHCGKIVVNKRVAVDKLYSEAGLNRCLRHDTEDRRRLSDNKRTKPLSAVQGPVPHCRNEARGCNTRPRKGGFGKVGGERRLDALGMCLHISIEGVDHGGACRQDGLGGKASLYTGSGPGRKPVQAHAGQKRSFSVCRPFSMGHL